MTTGRGTGCGSVDVFPRKIRWTITRKDLTDQQFPSRADPTDSVLNKGQTEPVNRRKRDVRTPMKRTEVMTKSCQSSKVL